MSFETCINEVHRVDVLTENSREFQFYRIILSFITENLFEKTTLHDGGVVKDVFDINQKGNVILLVTYYGNSSLFPRPIS